MTELAPGSVTIADLYRELVGLRSDVVRSLTRLEVLESKAGDGSAIHTDHETRLRALEAALPDQAENRITNLERFKYTLMGGVIVTSAASAAIASWITALATHH